MADSPSEEVSISDKLHTLGRVAKYRPKLTTSILIASTFAAVLEGIGLSFILPIIEIVQSPQAPTENTEGLLQVFVYIYQTLEIPFTLGTVVTGVSLVLTVRWVLTFFVQWWRGALGADYTRELQTRAFSNALDARVGYFDQEGSDDILNAIVTQSEYAARVITSALDFLQQSFLTIMYLTVAVLISPLLTGFAIVFLGGLSIMFRYVLESGFDIGDRVANANERVHQTAQAGTQGIRDTKLFGLKKELLADFLDAVGHFADASIKQSRNQSAIGNFYNLITAVSIFIMIYIAIRFANMSLSSLAVFLFAMFRLGPKLSALNTKLYQLENNLPHLVRMQSFIDELAQNHEPRGSNASVPEEVSSISFEDVTFSYDGQNEESLSGVSFEFNKGNYIGLVGTSGAGKSTVISLLARLYEPDSGKIRANGDSIHEMPIQEWHKNISIVRQSPYIFHETLRYNLTIGDRNASDEEIKQACKAAKVDEFVDQLSQGYDTQLGDQGIRLSGGQKQRVALARALLKDAEILILDEATSDLDSSLEEEVQNSIENLEGDYAIVTIAHRLSTVRNADRIYTFSSGKIIEKGTHQELLASSGKYAELYQKQSDKY